MVDMKDPKVIWAWVGGVIVVIALVVSAFWRFSGAGNKVAVGSVVAAPTGQLVAGFPHELILDAAAQVSDSYSIDYSSSTDQYTTEWVSSSSAATLAQAYVQYFASSGWTVVNSSTEAPTYYSLYAVTSTADANVVMATRGNALDVTVSYIRK